MRLGAENSTRTMSNSGGAGCRCPNVDRNAATGRQDNGFGNRVDHRQWRRHGCQGGQIGRKCRSQAPAAHGGQCRLAGTRCAGRNSRVHDQSTLGTAPQGLHAVPRRMRVLTAKMATSWRQLCSSIIRGSRPPSLTSGGPQRRKRVAPASPVTTTGVHVPAGRQPLHASRLPWPGV